MDARIRYISAAITNWNYSDATTLEAIADLIDFDTGSATGISVTRTSTGTLSGTSIGAGGDPGTGDAAWVNDGKATAGVLKLNSGATLTDTYSGLDNDETYTVECYGINSSAGKYLDISADSRTDRIETGNNLTETAKITGISPVGGEIAVTYGGDGDQYMGASRLLEEVAPPGLSVSISTDLQPGQSFSATAANFASAPTSPVAVKQGSISINVAVTITDNGSGSYTLSGTMPALTGGGTSPLFGQVDFEVGVVSTTVNYVQPSGLTLTTLVEPIENYVDQSWTAQAEAGEQVLFDSDDLTISENLNLSAEAEGVYSYWYINNAGAVFNPTFTVQNLPAIDDGTDPVEPGYPSLTLTGGNVFAEAGTTWVDPGYTATDSVDGVITGDVQITGTVDTDTLGPVTLTYSVTNSQSNTTTQTRTVTVRDTIAPVITLTGGTVTLAIDDTFTDPGYSALDSFEGDVTAGMEVTGTVDTATDSTWLLVYTATDSSGNSASRIRRVVVGTGGKGKDKKSIAQPIARNIFTPQAILAEPISESV